MSDHKIYNWDEIMKHNKESDCWNVINGFVVDMTDWLPNHPGGADPIIQMSGNDLTNMYEAIQAHHHGGRAEKEWKSRIIGKVDPTSVRPKPKATTERRLKAEKPIRYGLNVDPKYFWLAVLCAIVALVYFLM